MPSPNANSVRSKLLKIPAFKRDLIALWKDSGPGWMLAAVNTPPAKPGALGCEPLKAAGEGR